MAYLSYDIIRDVFCCIYESFSFVRGRDNSQCNGMSFFYDVKMIRAIVLPRNLGYKRMCMCRRIDFPCFAFLFWGNWPLYKINFLLK